MPSHGGDHVVDRLSSLLPEDALREALQGLRPEEITGPGGLVTQLTGRVLEAAALDAEMSARRGDPAARAPRSATGSHRHRHTPRTARPRLGPVRVGTPRERHGGAASRLVRTRPSGLDDWVLELYAAGLPVRDIAAELERLYGVAIGLDTISAVTHAALDGLAAWRARPLDEVYPIVYFDTLQVKVTDDRSVRTSACYLAVGVTVDGDREALGIWWQDTDGATFWPGVLDDLRQRGVRDVLITCVDEVGGLSPAIAAAFPEPGVQTCLVHQIRSSMRYVNYRDRRELANDLRSVYGAATAEDALAELAGFDETWGGRYSMLADAWRARWEHIAPALSLPDEVRRVVYPTNTIEAVYRHIGKSIKTRGHFPDEQAATELIYLAIERADTAWRSVRGWTCARRALKVHFGDRLPG